MKLVNMYTWINLEGIANIIFISRPEKYGYHVTYDTKYEWVVYTPEGGEINFKRKSGECKGIPHMELIKTYSRVMAIQILRK